MKTVSDEIPLKKMAYLEKALAEKIADLEKAILTLKFYKESIALQFQLCQKLFSKEAE